MTDFTIPTSVYIGAAGIGIGFVLLFLIVKGITGGRMMRVPDGEQPAAYYKRWRDAALSKKFSRAFLFILFAALFMIIGGLVAIIGGLALL